MMENYNFYVTLFFKIFILPSIIYLHDYDKENYLLDEALLDDLEM